MPKLTDLGLQNKALDDASVDFSNLPKQGGSAPPPEPGTYVFALPAAAALAEAFDVTDSTDHGQRIKVDFADAAALTIKQSKGNAYNGTAFRTTLTNIPRNRARKGQPEILVSDLNYLLKALGETVAPKTNQAAAQALLKYAGKPFQADLEWSWSCNPEKAIWVESENGQTEEVPDSKGCGARYYQKDVEGMKDEAGKFPLRITCAGENCGASIRAFANLRNFQPVGGA